MTDQIDSVLRRKITAHARPSDVDAASKLATGVERALRRAAMGFPALGLRISDVAPVMSETLETVIDKVPPTGMIVVLETGQGSATRGCLAISHGLIDALIEVQTTGRVEAASLPPRPVTDIDQALSRDFLDLLIGAFRTEGGEVGTVPWPVDLRYGSPLADPMQLSLLLSSDAFHLVSVRIAFDGVDRAADVLFALPSVTVTRPPQTADGCRDTWNAAMAASLAQAPFPLETVLLRRWMSFGAVARLTPGDILPFSQTDLSQVQLEVGQAHVVMTGRLGQIGGKRAVRLEDDTSESASANAAMADPSPPRTGPSTRPSPPTAAAAATVGDHITSGMETDGQDPVADMPPSAPEIAPAHATRSA